MVETFAFPDDEIPRRLADRVFIVTGGASGIGRATAVYLGAAGATVVVNDLSEPTEVADRIRDQGGSAVTHAGDITSLEYTERLIDDTVEEFGRIHGVINFAGNLADEISYRMSGDQWDRVIDVHLRGHFSLIRNAASHWREKAGEGALDPQRSFVSLTSRQAFGAVGQLNYSAAKAGILGLTWTAAAELDRYNIRVNALMPLAFTRMIESIPEEKRPEDWTRERMPPGKVAPVAAFLLSDEADGINGCVVRSHGDVVGLLSEPEINRRAYREGGWTFESLCDEFRTAVGGDDTALHRRN